MKAPKQRLPKWLIVSYVVFVAVSLGLIGLIQVASHDLEHTPGVTVLQHPAGVVTTYEAIYRDLVPGHQYGYAIAPGLYDSSVPVSPTFIGFVPASRTGTVKLPVYVPNGIESFVGYDIRFSEAPGDGLLWFVKTHMIDGTAVIVAILLCVTGALIGYRLDPDDTREPAAQPTEVPVQ